MSHRHIARVLDSVASGTAAARSRLAASWGRSFHAHGLDPAARVESSRIEQAALNHRAEAMEGFLTIANPRLDSLSQLIGQSGFGVLLTDAEGVVLERRCAPGDEASFSQWGLAPGADWSEAAEGTNGIGTCLAEERALIIDRDDHFLARNIGMSCIDAPIWGPDARLIGALDVSSARADQTAAMNQMIAAMVQQTARAIETEAFAASYAGRRIVMAKGADAGAGALLAVDRDDIVVGATRAARRMYGLAAQGVLAPVPAVDLLGRETGPGGFDGAERAALIRALARANGNASAAARALGIGRATLYRRLDRLGLSPDGQDLSRN